MLRNLRYLLHRVFRRQDLQRDLDAEIASHLAMDTRQRIEQGESPQSARQATLRQFGNVGLVAWVTRRPPALR